ncbi:hypothetical protein RFI_23916 [Reticulomyxa filosa]|uniref:Uncharacterized protein n=1 Tax=Reticulomyxa filosa TaxID=46433 RepID=X6MHX0_RETFI|nr:hypothetical protein RFI_23916 [Reticulomyxa filosa]|eukprot:ETO13454.1 hypothetical protein RFI_23916 [Reticulomyxa filosa]
MVDLLLEVCQTKQNESLTSGLLQSLLTKPVQMDPRNPMFANKCHCLCELITLFHTHAIPLLSIPHDEKREIADVVHLVLSIGSRIITLSDIAIASSAVIIEDNDQKDPVQESSIHDKIHGCVYAMIRISCLHGNISLNPNVRIDTLNHLYECLRITTVDTNWKWDYDKLANYNSSMVGCIASLFDKKIEVKNIYIHSQWLTMALQITIQWIAILKPAPIILDEFRNMLILYGFLATLKRIEKYGIHKNYKYAKTYTNFMQKLKGGKEKHEHTPDDGIKTDDKGKQPYRLSFSNDLALNPVSRRTFQPARFSHQGNIRPRSRWAIGPEHMPKRSESEIAEQKWVEKIITLILELKEELKRKKINTNEPIEIDSDVDNELSEQSSAESVNNPDDKPITPEEVKYLDELLKSFCSGNDKKHGDTSSHLKRLTHLLRRCVIEDDLLSSKIKDNQDPQFQQLFISVSENEATTTQFRYWNDLPASVHRILSNQERDLALHLKILIVMKFLLAGTSSRNINFKNPKLFGSCCFI